jgi:quinoprotein dehydrogenase-associated probable ABC transporter substrate-binding protein
MCSRCLSAIVALVTLAAAALAAAEPARVVRFCVDPDNMPYSREGGDGLEVKIARIVAAQMGAEAELVWFPLRRGFVRKTLGAGLCDVIPGVPAHFERVLATRPYYRSGYAFVARHGGLASFDDPRIASSRIGVQLVGNDLAATPPGHALVSRGAIGNVRGFAVYGDGPAAQRIVSALDAGELDAGLLWGPQAGYFALHSRVPLEVHLARAPPQLHDVPFEYAIAMGVQRGNTALRDALDRAIDARRGEIDAVLDEYAVPRVRDPKVAAR